MLFHRRSYRPQAGPVERALTAAAVLGLVFLALWFDARGRQVDPRLFRLDEGSLATGGDPRRIFRRKLVVQESVGEAADPVAALLGDEIPGTAFRRRGPVEAYGPDTLYEKIDGREGLYKSYGFRRLWFASYQAAGEDLDLEVFRHQDAAGAFGVFATERRGMEGAGLEATRTVTPNGLYLVVAEYYLRLQGSAASPTIRQASEALAAHLSRGLGGTAAPPAEGPGPEAAPRPSTCPAGYDEACQLPVRGTGGDSAAAHADLAALMAAPEAWSPASNPLLALGADPAALELHREFGLGVEGFDGLFVGALPLEGRPVKAFLLAKADASQAAAAFEAYAAVLERTGAATEVDWGPRPPARRRAVLVDMLDSYELVFASGRFVAGVTEAEDATAAAGAAARLAEALALAP